MSGPVLRGTNLNFFLARAEQARTEGEEATLEHVRERCRRSEAAWTALADKARRSERLRVEELERKAKAIGETVARDSGHPPD
jgi:hypothetical protein